jgi:hypothetical protein
MCIGKACEDVLGVIQIYSPGQLVWGWDVGSAVVQEYGGVLLVPVF